MKVQSALLCPDCDEIFEGKECPKCNNRFCVPIRNYLPPVTIISPLQGEREKYEKALSYFNTVYGVPTVNVVNKSNQGVDPFQRISDEEYDKDGKERIDEMFKKLWDEHERSLSDCPEIPPESKIDNSNSSSGIQPVSVGVVKQRSKRADAGDAFEPKRRRIGIQQR